MNIKQVDARGLKCPMPIVKAKKESDALQAGEQLEVLATDPGSVADFQGWAKLNPRIKLVAQRTTSDEQGHPIFIHVLERAS